MAPKKNYSILQMRKAIEAVNEGEKVAVAAKRFGVPRITLYNKISGKSPITCSMGPATYLSKEEELILERWILEMFEHHIPISKDDLLDSVQRIITEKGQETPFVLNRPGNKWYNLFLKRHPIITTRTAQNLTTARDNVTEEDIVNWFREVEKYLKEKDLHAILDNPERIYNTDESAFFLSPKPGRVLAKKGEKHVYSSSGDEKENLTVLITGNAAGKLAPPMVVFSYERIPSTIANNFPPNWGIGRSDTGWMCSSTFYEYIVNIFDPWLTENNIERPVLFFLDGHKSHLNLHLSNFCCENGIEIIALNPNSTHLMQPMDLSVFRPLKSSWRKAVNSWKVKNLGQSLRKEHFAPLLKTALESLSEDSIRNGFRGGGLCPFGPEYVDMSKIKTRRCESENSEDVSRINFLSFLEDEIRTTFRAEKLKLFKQMYNTNREGLESALPDEDLSLYMIWAKNKQALLGVANIPQISPDQLQESIPGTSHDHLEETYLQKHITGTSRNYQKKTTQQLIVSEIPQDNTKDSAKQKSIPGISRLTIDGTPQQQRIPETSYELEEQRPIPETSHDLEETLQQQTVPQPSQKDLAETPQQEHIPETSEDLEETHQKLPMPETSQNLPETRQQQPVSEPSQDLAETPQQEHIPETSEDLEETHQKLPMPETSQDNTENSANKQQSIAGTSRHHMEITPQKGLAPSTVSNIPNTNKLTKIGFVIPSPFKRNLFWPDEIDHKKTKRRLKEKIPAAITSERWREYHEKKEAEKKRQLIEKEKRAEERARKKILKQKTLADKKKQKKRTKNITLPEDSSDNTDTEVQYAESDESIYDIEMDVATHSQKLNTQKNKISKLPETSSESDSEKIPLTKLASTGKKISKGCYVIITYEGEYFPGVVESVDRNNFEISTMTFSTGNTYRWPEKPDKIWYERKDIVEKIETPILCNKRGFYMVKEMNKFLTFTV